MWLIGNYLIFLSIGEHILLNELRIQTTGLNSSKHETTLKRLFC